MIQVNERYAIRIEELHSVAPHTEMLVVAVLDNGSRQPLLSRDQAREFFRQALLSESAAMYEYRREVAQIRSVTPPMSSGPYPLFSVSFDVTFDFNRERRVTPHVMTYFDAANEIRIRLATAEDVPS